MGLDSRAVDSCFCLVLRGTTWLVLHIIGYFKNLKDYLSTSRVKVKRWAFILNSFKCSFFITGVILGPRNSVYLNWSLGKQKGKVGLKTKTLRTKIQLLNWYVYEREPSATVSHHPLSI